MFKGLESVRTDWTPLARSFQRELYRRVFEGEPFEAWVRDTVEALHAGEHDADFVYRKRLRQSVNAYTRNVPPHVQAARKLGRNVRWVRYVITASGPEPVEDCLVSTGFNFGEITAPVLFGFILDRSDPGFVFWVVAFVCLVGVLTVTSTARARRESSARSGLQPSGVPHDALRQYAGGQASDAEEQGRGACALRTGDSRAHQPESSSVRSRMTPSAFICASKASCDIGHATSRSNSSLVRWH